MLVRTLKCLWSAIKIVLNDNTQVYLTSVHKRMHLIRAESMLLMNVKILEWAETPMDQRHPVEHMCP